MMVPSARLMFCAAAPYGALYVQNRVSPSTLCRECRTVFNTIRKITNNIFIVPHMYSICPNCLTGRRLRMRITGMNMRIRTPGATLGENDKVGSGYPANFRRSLRYSNWKTCVIATSSDAMRTTQPNLRAVRYQSSGHTPHLAHHIPCHPCSGISHRLIKESFWQFKYWSFDWKECSHFPETSSTGPYYCARKKICESCETRTSEVYCSAILEEKANPKTLTEAHHIHMTFTQCSPALCKRSYNEL